MFCIRSIIRLRVNDYDFRFRFHFILDLLQITNKCLSTHDHNQKVRRNAYLQESA